MNVVLTPDIEKFFKEQIESGNYQDALAVIREGLQLLAL
ncbi:ribbon-helix-helix domain-containing protein [Dapis sp. BLCC M229]